MQDRAQSSLLALRRILRATRDNTRRIARATGLSAPQLMVLQIVAEAGEATPKTIARSAGIAPATTTALIEKLVSRGYARRERGTTDRRQSWVSLTDEGRAALDSAPDPLHQQFTEKFDRIPDWEQAMLVAALERVAAMLAAEAAREPAVSAPVLTVAEEGAAHEEGAEVSRAS